MSYIKQDEAQIELNTDIEKSFNQADELSVVRNAHAELGNEETQELIKNLKAEVELFKSQLQDVRKKVLTQSQRDNYSSDGLELNAVQNSITDQTTKIGDLEYKIKILKAELEKKSTVKTKRKFGKLGWVLMGSNLLLWSMLGWFIWQYYRGNTSSENTVNNLVNKQQVNETNSDRTAQSVSTPTENTVVELATENGKPRGLPAISSTNALTQLGATRQNSSAFEKNENPAANRSKSNADFQNSLSSKNTANQNFASAKLANVYTNKAVNNARTNVASRGNKTAETTAFKKNNTAEQQINNINKSRAFVSKKVSRNIKNSKRGVVKKTAAVQKRSVRKTSTPTAKKRQNRSAKAQAQNTLNKSAQPQVRFGD